MTQTPKASTNSASMKFNGYSSPNYTQVPDELFDEQLAYLSGAELKVLLYIMRRTFGFKKESDNISLNQICKGIVTKEGEILDRGTGLSLSTAQIAIKGLIAKHSIITIRRVSKERGNEPTAYKLNTLPSTENRHRGGMKIGKGLYRKSVIQETDKQDTDLQYRDISSSKASKHAEDTGRPPTTLTPIAALLTTKQTLIANHKNNRFSKAPPPPEIESAIRDVSSKLSDTKHIRENISQAAHLFWSWGGVNGSSFASFVYEACSITRQQDAVKKQMPYFFRVLKGLLGLAETEQGSIAPG